MERQLPGALLRGKLLIVVGNTLRRVIKRHNNDERRSEIITGDSVPERLPFEADPARAQVIRDFFLSDRMKEEPLL
jgi:hypothetical protein